MYVCTYVRMYVCTYVRMYVCTYVRMYVCTYVRMYVHMYVKNIVFVTLDKYYIDFKYLKSNIHDRVFQLYLPVGRV